MMKNRFLTAFAFAGLIGFAACAADETDEATFDEAAPLEEVTPAPDIAPAPVTVDSVPAITDSVVVDSATM